jgi:hypothetical protein
MRDDNKVFDRLRGDDIGMKGRAANGRRIDELVGNVNLTGRHPRKRPGIGIERVAFQIRVDQIVAEAAGHEEAARLPDRGGISEHAADRTDVVRQQSQCLGPEFRSKARSVNGVDGRSMVQGWLRHQQASRRKKNDGLAIHRHHTTMRLSRMRRKPFGVHEESRCQTSTLGSAGCSLPQPAK